MVSKCQEKMLAIVFMERANWSFKWLLHDLDTDYAFGVALHLATVENALQMLLEYRHQHFYNSIMKQKKAVKLNEIGNIANLSKWARTKCNVSLFVANKSDS